MLCSTQRLRQVSLPSLSDLKKTCIIWLLQLLKYCALCDYAEWNSPRSESKKRWPLHAKRAQGSKPMPRENYRERYWKVRVLNPELCRYTVYLGVQRESAGWKNKKSEGRESGIKCVPSRRNENKQSFLFANSL